MSDCDGFTSSSILWLYIKHIFPKANLNFTLHEHKQHGLDDKIDWLETLNDIDLVICPDSASYDVEEHQRLADLGIDIYNTPLEKIAGNIHKKLNSFYLTHKIFNFGSISFLE